MNWITIAFGVVALGFGLAATYVRLTAPQKFGKLEAMKQKFGATVGTAIHVVAYSVFPIAAGILFLYMGWRGISLF